MKNWQIDWKLSQLSEKIQDYSPGSGVRLDFESLSEEEKLVCEKLGEVYAEVDRTGNLEILAKYQDLQVKSVEIALRRITELYSEVMIEACAITAPYELVKYYFTWHFLNFQEDIVEVMRNIRRMTEAEQEEEIAELAKNGSVYFRIPRWCQHCTSVWSAKKSKKDLQIKQAVPCPESESPDSKLESALQERGGSERG